MKKTLAFVLAMLTMTISIAQTTFPSQAVRWIVPYAAGGSVDTFSRTLVEGMRQSLGQSIVVDNRPGGATNIAVTNMLQSKPDGYTVMHAETAALFFNEHLFSKLSYKPESDFTYIAALGRFPVVLVVGADIPVKTLAEFMDYAKANAQTISYASPGNGTMHHMAMELFKQAKGLTMQHVPYRGGMPALQDLIGGRIAAMMVEPTVALGAIRAGQLRPLAIAGKNRITALPGVPTFAEVGLPQVEGYTLHGLIGPAGMPEDATRRLNAEVLAGLKQPRIVAWLADTGYESVGNSPEEFKKLARSESERWGRVIKATGFKLE